MLLPLRAEDELFEAALHLLSAAKAIENDPHAAVGMARVAVQLANAVARLATYFTSPEASARIK